MHCCTFVRPDFSKQISRLVQVTLESKDFSVGFKFQPLFDMANMAQWNRNRQSIEALPSSTSHLFLTKLFRHDSSGAESKFTSSRISWLPGWWKRTMRRGSRQISHITTKKHTKNIQIHPNSPNHKESIESSHMLSSGSQGRLPTALTEWSRKRTPETPQRPNPQWEENSVNIPFNEYR